MADLAQILIDAVQRGASDIVIKAGNSPLARIKGELIRLYPDAPSLMPPDTESMVRQLMPEYRIKEFENEQEADCAYAVPGLGRFRVNAFKQRGSTSMVLRAIPVEAPTSSRSTCPASCATWRRRTAGSCSSRERSAGHHLGGFVLRHAVVRPGALR